MAFADIQDLITGEMIPWNDDEPVRQLAERRLLDLGFAKDRIRVGAARTVGCGGSPLCINADLLVLSEDQPALIIRCARGSLVSREKEAIASARLFADPALPLAAVYNSEDAVLLDTASGQVLSRGLGSLPSPAELEDLVAGRDPFSPTEVQLIQAARIYDTFSFITCPPV